MLSSSKPEKSEAKFAARIDVLTERVDTLASTVATTASAIAKKDGEIASLRRDLQARDAAIESLAAQARAASQANAEHAPLDANELRSLRNAVAALAKERADASSTSRLGDLAADVRALAQRVDLLANEATDGPGAGGGAELAQRLDALAAELVSLRATVERTVEAERPPGELSAMLTTLRTQVDALATLRAGATDESVLQRLADADDATERLSGRLDSLATTVDSAVSSLADKEHELAALHRHFTESSERIEAIVEDIRDALSALPEPAAVDADELMARVARLTERVESFDASSREAAATSEQTAADLMQRLSVVEQRVATMASDVARAKTLWPIALRSLEARLEDVAGHARRPDSSTAPDPGVTSAVAEDTPDESLLAGLRDSLQAMESVAAEMARVSDVFPPAPIAPAPSRDDVSDDTEPVAAAGGTIVPLRSPDG
jgi:DNA repair exonuclease SbcCD ATPase subunit